MFGSPTGTAVHEPFVDGDGEPRWDGSWILSGIKKRQLRLFKYSSGQWGWNLHACLFVSGHGALSLCNGDGGFQWDGKVDLAVANITTIPSPFCWHGDGTSARFQLAGECGRNPTDLVSGDFDGDGSSIWRANSTDNALTILLGNGTAHFRLSLRLRRRNNSFRTGGGGFQCDGSWISQWRTSMKIRSPFCSATAMGRSRPRFASSDGRPALVGETSMRRKARATVTGRGNSTVTILLATAMDVHSDQWMLRHPVDLTHTLGMRLETSMAMES